MSDIFLCYSRADSAIAQKVASRLQAEKWSVFMDVQTQVGARWQKVIQRELDEARAVVVLWTAASCASDYVFEEAEHGRRRNVLFPVLLERVQIPYGFLPIQTADMIGWQGAEDHIGLHQLLKPLRLHLLHTQPSPGDAPSALVPPLTPTAPGERFRDRLRDGGEGPLMAVLPAGRFLMGSPIDEPGGCDDEGDRRTRWRFRTSTRWAYMLSLSKNSTSSAPQRIGSWPTTRDGVGLGGPPSMSLGTMPGLIAHGSGPKLANVTVCPASLNGSTPVAQARVRPSALAKQSRPTEPTSTV